MFLAFTNTFNPVFLNVLNDGILYKNRIHFPRNCPVEGNVFILCIQFSFLFFLWYQGMNSGLCFPGRYFAVELNPQPLHSIIDEEIEAQNLKMTFLRAASELVELGLSFLMLGQDFFFYGLLTMFINLVLTQGRPIHSERKT